MILTLKSRLLLSVLSVLLVGFIFGSLFILHNAREAVEDEVSSSIQLADQIVQGLTFDPSSTGKITDTPLQATESIDRLRHIQLLVEHQYQEQLLKEDQDVEGVPRWFTRLVTPDEAIPLSLRVHRQAADDLVIAADPADEIQEVWRDVEDLIILFACLIGAICLFVYLLINHALKPLTALREGFLALENDQLNVRISEKAVPELASIHRRFNHMVGVLADTTQAKRDLTRKLITLQEDERNLIARELHDEMGPYLFSIRVDITSAKSHLEQAPDLSRSRLDNIDQTTVQLQARIRALLKQLRPLSLNDLSLEESLHDLIRSFTNTVPSSDWQCDFSLPADLPDMLNVTIYRIVQECLTNCARHANASTIHVTCHQDGEEMLIIEVRDNGHWQPETHQSGLGLNGMRERVEGLNGHFSMTENRPSGLIVTARIPAQSSQNQSITAE